MAPMQSASTVAFIDPSKLFARQKTAKTSSKANQQDFYLSSVLHSSLELEEVLQTFFREIQRVVTSDSMSYQNDGKDVCLNYGSESPHHCNFRVFTETDFLGELFFSRNKRFTDKELKLLESLISHLVSSLRNALVYREAVMAALKDPLTGAGNRLALDSSLEREMQLAFRHNHPFSLLMIDVDNFKQVNDSYGHQTGDKVLQNVAAGIIAVTRETDMLFRFGGEEFLVLLTKTCAEGSLVIAERIRAFIENSITSDARGEINVTVSIGSATLAPSENRQQLIEKVDKALYSAKTNGRNRVICARSLKTSLIEVPALS